jgi:WD40 repeat protein
VIFDLKKRRELHNFYVRDAATLDVKFSPDNTLLATAQYDKNIYLWEVKTAKRLGVLKKHTDAVKSLAFSWDGSMLASGGEDRKIIIWKSGAPQMPVTGKPVPGPGDATGQKTPGATGPGEQMVKIDGHLNLIKYPDARQFTRHWNTKGEVSLEKDAEEEDNYNFVIRYKGMVWQDVLINAEGRFVLLISWASSERVNPDGDQTGYPYLYGYLLNKSDRNRINAYLQGQQILLKTGIANEWGIIYGIFQVPPETGGIRLFLQQADGRLPQSGSAARFDEPGIFLFDTREQAEAFAKNY